MAATGYTPISLYYSTTASAVPVNTNLVNGELAINITDGKLYYKDNSGVVKLLASNAATTNVTTFSAGTTGFTPSSATSGAVTLAGTLATTNGGTGLTAFTSGGAVYATSTSALTTGTLPVTAGGTGLTTLATGYIPYGNGTSAFSSASTLSYNATSGLTVNGITQIANTTLYQTDATLSNYSAANAVYLNGNSAGWLSLQADGTQATQIQIYGSSNASPNIIRFLTANAERMRITATGLLCINGLTGTALTTIASSATYPALKVPNIVEPANVVGTAPTSTTNFYLSSGAVQYYTANTANNWTLNFAFSSGTSLNTAMAVGDSISCTMIVTNSTTAYYPSAFTIDGTSVTPKWQGGSAPTSGDASALDSYTFVIIKTASATYTVLASQTKFA